jgi:hypothetical protein
MPNKHRLASSQKRGAFLIEKRIEIVAKAICQSPIQPLPQPIRLEDYWVNLKFEAHEEWNSSTIPEVTYFLLP